MCVCVCTYIYIHTNVYVKFVENNCNGSLTSKAITYNPFRNLKVSNNQTVSSRANLQFFKNNLLFYIKCRQNNQIQVYKVFCV